MTLKSDLMDPLAVEMIGNRRVLVDSARPVAVVTEADGDIHFVTWPDAELPPLGATASVTTAPNGLWVIYTEYEIVTATRPPRTTAVFIGEDLSVTSVNVGELTAIGADADGLWCTSEPYPKVERAGDGEYLPEDISFDNDAPIEERENLRAAPVPFLSRVSDDIADDDSGNLGWTANRGIGFNRLNATDDSASESFFLPTPPDPVATGPVTLHRYRPDGGVDLLEVDRLVSDIELADGRLRLTYHPTGPIEKLSADRMSGSYSYPTESIDLDVSEGLPRQVAVSDFKSTPKSKGFPEEWIGAYLADVQSEEAARRNQPRIDLCAVEGTRWNLPAEVPLDIQHQVDVVADQLNGLGEPVLMWASLDDRYHRVHSEHRDLSVNIVGEWPAVEVIAEFRYEPRGDLRFRFRVPVFDAAGRPCVHRYFTTDLEEELDTADFDEVETTHDGFIEL